ncbi:MAG: hypothetical protein RL758_579 [Pseudomonadota bacterium]|jgi:carbon monoxide dehydrogenase subunit G
MQLLGERLIPAPIERTWAALNDPETLRLSMPGCESLERTETETFAALLTLRIGPVNAKFKGHLRLSDVVPLRGYKLYFEGQGGVAGFGKGSADVLLSAHDSSTTRLTYKAQAQIGGKIAQVGSRLVDATAAKIAEDFFKRFEDVLSQEEVTSGPEPGMAKAVFPTTPSTSTPGLWPWALAAGVLIAVLFSLLFV